MFGCTGGDKTASIALTSWGGGKETMGGGQQGAGSLLSSIGGGREGHYCGQHHGAGQEGQQHCGGPGAAEIAAMMNVVMSSTCQSISTSIWNRHTHRLSTAAENSTSNTRGHVRPFS